MKLAIMQPYLFPYIGYFQLLGSVDKFVIYDDVKWISGGWINRNRFLLNNKDIMVTLSVIKRSSHDNINQFEISENKNNREIFLNKIRSAYVESPYFFEIFPFVEQIVLNKEKNLTEYIKYSLEQINSYLGIETQILVSSQLVNNNILRGQERIIDICQLLKAKTYINSIGGIKLYDKETFQQNGLGLKFLKAREIRYLQFGKSFIPNLSIIDVLMFNSKKEFGKMLSDYDLL